MRILLMAVFLGGLAQICITIGIIVLTNNPWAGFLIGIPAFLIVYLLVINSD